MSIESSVDRRSTVLFRVAPLAGVLFGGLTFAGDLIIGPFPDGSTPAADLPAYYAAHGSQVTLGGTVLGWAAVCLAVFGVAVWARVRAGGVPPVVAGLVLLGAAVDTMASLFSAAVYSLLGGIGVDPHVSSSALQALHVLGAELGVGGGATILLLGIALAGFGYRAIPLWLAGTGVVLGIGQFAPHPWGFFAALAYLAWAAAAGIALAVRAEPGSTTRKRVPETVA
jgi:hypothetical protein